MLSFSFPFLTILGFVIVFNFSHSGKFVVVHFLKLVIFDNIASGIFKMG